ncbi:alpha/beta hydrolase [Patescibacteria group bacterium]|nr:alpha/beta hydrolase [Patescibacteria group bacterium]
MKTAIILHGKPSKEGYYNPERGAQSNEHWLPWIQRKLLLKDYLAQAPELPEPYDPDYEKWRSVFERFDINEDTILIGHSRGGAFLIRWLSENKVKTDKVALVAPSIRDDKKEEHGFFDFEIDKEFPNRTKGVTVLYSTDDSGSVASTVDTLKKSLEGDVEYIEFTNKGHLTFGDMGTVEFPELEKALLGD